MKLAYLPIYILFFFVVGCQSSNEDIKKTIEDIKRSTPATIEKLPDLKEYTPIVYSAGKSTDPFDPSNNQTISNKNIAAPAIKMQSKRPDFERPREYLENFPLDTLVMVGILERKNETWALIVDRSGILHKVKKGNYLGQNSGKITKINEEDIDIEEIVSDDQGGWTNRDASIKIKRK